MDWTFYMAGDRPHFFIEGALEAMRIHNEHVVQLLLAGIMGVVSLGVSNLKELNTKLQTIAVVLSETKAESNLRLNQHDQILQDHENRIRYTESKRRQKQQ